MVESLSEPLRVPVQCQCSVGRREQRAEREWGEGMRSAIASRGRTGDESQNGSNEVRTI